MSASLVDPRAAVRACVVTIGGEEFALDLAAVREVVVFDHWTRVPLAPAHVVGAANLRGAVMPIVDAHAALGRPERRPERRLRTLVVAGDGLEAAVVIDGVVALETFGDVEEAGEAAAPDAFVLGAVRREGRSVPLLDAGGLLRALVPGGAGVTA